MTDTRAVNVTASQQKADTAIVYTPTCIGRQEASNEQEH